MTSGFENEVTAPEVRPRTGLIAAAALIVLAGVAAGVSWWWWTRTPQYALRQVAAAYRSHDLEKFDEYVDRERLAGSFVDQMLQHAFKEQEGKSGGENWASGLAQGMAMMMRPQLVKALSDSIEQGVESGDFAEKKEDGPSLSPYQTYLQKADDGESGFRGIKSVSKQGKVAVAKLELYDKDFGKSAFLDVKLRNVGGHWQVIELSNLAEFMKTLSDFEQEYLAKLNAPIKRQLTETIMVDSGTAYVDSDRWGIRKQVQISARFSNKTKRRIDEFSGLLHVISANGSIAATIPIQVEQGLTAQGAEYFSWGKDINMFSSDDEKLYNAVAEAGEDIAVEVHRIRFDDGSEVKLLISRPQPTKKIEG